MKLVSGLKSRARLAWRGPRAIGEYYRPILSSLHLAGARIEVEFEPVLSSLGLAPAADGKSPELSSLPETFPLLYNSDHLTRCALWHVVRQIQPEFVVETGVANGLSSMTILDALEHNGSGRLLSFDIDAKAASSVPASMRARWDFQLLDPARPMRDLKKATAHLGGKVGVWFHDSDHSYQWQFAEYELAAEMMAPGGVLLSDDADGTEAFADFCLAHRDWRASALFDTRKVCGLARRPSA